MKRFNFAALVIAIALLFSYGGDTSAQQVGIGGSQYVPKHGHNGDNDGGLLNASCFKASLTSDQGVTCGTINIVQLATNDSSFTNYQWFDTGTYKYTPLQAGKYLFIVNVFVNATTPAIPIAYIYKNASLLQAFFGVTYGGVEAHINGSVIAFMNGTTDYVQLEVMANGASACSIYHGPFQTWFQGIRISN